MMSEAMLCVIWADIKKQTLERKMKMKMIGTEQVSANPPSSSRRLTDVNGQNKGCTVL